MKVRVDRLQHPVTTLGPGRRIGIWFQGCSIGCSGCLSRDTWDPEGAPESTVAEVVTAMRSLCPGGPDGVTISGGEPFEQAAALAELVAGIRAWSTALGRPLDILVYSGFSFDVLRRDHSSILEALDAIVPEPYVAGVPATGPWRGSGNQPLVILSPLGRERFVGMREGSFGGLQVAAEHGRLWMIGVPRTGDLARFAAAMRSRGVELEDVSWRP